MSILVNREAPDFTAAAVLGDGSIVDNYNFKKATEGKYSIIFFYPLDFTFVCPSELIALDHAMEEFKDRNVEVIAVSIDSQFTHNAWRNTSVKKGGIGQVKFTMVADCTHMICRSFGVEHPQAGVAFRGVFFMDTNGIVRSQTVNDLPLGRSIPAIIRIVDAWQFHEKHGEVCPANWQKGQSGMKASPEGVAEYLSAHEEEL